MNAPSGKLPLALMVSAAVLVAAMAPVLSVVPDQPAREVASDRSLPPIRIEIDLERHMLYVLDGVDTVFAAPVATGMDRGFEYLGRTYYFFTPRGSRTVLAKSRDPVWTIPDWHYYEKGFSRGLEPIHLREGDDVRLSDGTVLTVRDGQPGRVNRYGFFAPFPTGVEIIFDSCIFIPPLTSPQRKVHGVLGPYKLDLGDGYLVHGTNRYTEGSVGSSASHGCIRMANDDLGDLYEMVPVGTRVDIH